MNKQTSYNHIRRPYAVEKDLEDMEYILRDTVLSILDRGEKLERLSNASKDLRKNSEFFWKKSRSMHKKNAWIFALPLIVIVLFYILWY